MTPAAPTVCFGELLLRLTPPDRDLLLRSRMLAVHVGGAEANVAVGLAGLGGAAKMVSVVPDSAIGRHVLAELRAAGVDTAGVRLGDGRMGLYFMSQGASVRASEILYDRAGSLFAEAGPDDFDWDALLAGAGRLHLSGITPALGARPAALALAAAQAAARLGVPVSFDGNYRVRLWQAWGGDARAILSELVGHAEVLFGNHRDVALLTGRALGGDTPGERRAAAEAAFAAFPRLRLMASTERLVDGAAHYALSARVDTRERGIESERIALSGIVERIGAGDAFAAGVLHGLGAAGDDIDDALRAGLGLACLKHTVPGDASALTPADLDAFWAGEREVRR